jgi:hypothetical protein
MLDADELDALGQLRQIERIDLVFRLTDLGHVGLLCSCDCVMGALSVNMVSQICILLPQII